MTQTDETAYHYQIVRRAIEAIDAGATDLSLEALAAEAGLSPAHFQRVFSKWAGVSPKRFQQFLTLGHARELLRSRATTFDTAIETGLSGGGRLHDLFLRWEAMSPGDYARGGAGLTIRYGYGPTPFGEAVILRTGRGICGLGFCEDMGRAGAFDDLKRRWPAASYHPDPEAPAVLAALFAPRGETRLLLIGAPFQIKVWEALLSVPSGQVTTYGDIASAIGSPRAVRAVGTAVGRNPISWLIPCHRALRKSGGLGGYHWGLPLKRTMLAYETAQSDAPHILHTEA